MVENERELTALSTNSSLELVLTLVLENFHSQLVAIVVVVFGSDLAKLVWKGYFFLESLLLKHCLFITAN